MLLRTPLLPLVFPIFFSKVFHCISKDFLYTSQGFPFDCKDFLELSIPRFSIRFQRFPIVDVSIPTIDLMAEILDSIKGHLGMGKNVYVHCWGGSGRTGTVVGCWLLESGLATTSTVLETIQNLRIGDLDGGYKPSPQTREQAEFILNWGS